MKCDPWEQYEEDFLREVASSMTVEDIGEKLSRTTSAIICKASRMKIKLTAKKDIRPWTQWDDEMVLTQPIKIAADLTGRSANAIKARRFKLNHQEAA